MIIQRKCFVRFVASLAAICLLFGRTLTVRAEQSKEERIAVHQAMPIQSNQVNGWPTGPVVSAESAILMEAETGTILYSKNIHQKQYPASTTKILTALLTYENVGMDEIVTFSKEDVFGIPRNSNHVAMDVGDTLSVQDCLNALLIRSANEVAYALAAHVGGSWDGFVDMMNKRAAELGAVDSNFANPNGLPNEEHVTSAYDLAMIGRAFFSYDTLCKITMSPKLVVPKPKGDLIEWNQMALIPRGKYAYDYLVGCKTGYTDAAHSTLVSCAEKNGMRLICVVLNDENPQHNEDTIALFEYGFSNFDKINVSQAETRYDIDNIGLFYNSTGIFGKEEPLLSLDKEACVVIPKGVSFQDLKADVTYDTEVPGQAALIQYFYKDVLVGNVSLNLTNALRSNFAFEEEVSAETQDTTQAETQDATQAQPNNPSGEQGSEDVGINPSSPEAPPSGTSPDKKKPFLSGLLSLTGKLLIILIVLAVLFGIWIFLRKNIQFSFGPRLHRSRTYAAQKRELRNDRERRREHRSQVRAAKKRYKERIRRRY